MKVSRRNLIIGVVTVSVIIGIAWASNTTSVHNTGTFSTVANLEIACVNGSVSCSPSSTTTSTCSSATGYASSLTVSWGTLVPGDPNGFSQQFCMENLGNSAGIGTITGAACSGFTGTLKLSLTSGGSPSSITFTGTSTSCTPSGTITYAASGTPPASGSTPGFSGPFTLTLTAGIGSTLNSGSTQFSFDVTGN